MRSRRSSPSAAGQRHDSEHDRLWRIRGTGEGIDGMIHVSDLSWTRKINHPSEMFKKGDEVEAVVIDIDKVNQRISLGLNSWPMIRGKRLTRI